MTQPENPIFHARPLLLLLELFYELLEVLSLTSADPQSGDRLRKWSRSVGRNTLKGKREFASTSRLVASG